jgi:Flp pilus assembly protein TadD
MIIMGSKAIDIPAGATDYAVADRYRLPVDVDVLSVYPHAHYLGREMDVRAIAADGTSRSLLHIKQWSFNWQQDYRFVAPVSLARGTTIAMRYTYDNSAGNRRNPHQPPRRVTWGPQSHDEMGNLGIQVVTKSAADAAQLRASFAAHAAMIDVAGADTLTKADPNSATHAAFLGASLVRAGRPREAIPALERALALEPNSASSENYLGGALAAVGRTPEALIHLRNAVRLAPRDPHIRFNHGKVLAAAGQGSRAFAELARALEIDPLFGEAHHEAGVLLFSAGRVNDAIAHLQRAAELLPRSADARGDLGGALAEAGRPDEAMAQLRRALDIDPANQTARQNLALLEGRKPR